MKQFRKQAGRKKQEPNIGDRAGRGGKLGHPRVWQPATDLGRRISGPSYVNKPVQQVVVSKGLRLALKVNAHPVGGGALVEYDFARRISLFLRVLDKPDQVLVRQCVKDADQAQGLHKL